MERRPQGRGLLGGLAMSLYLAVKVIWIAAGLLGHGPEDVGTAGWVALNAVTVGMSAIGVAFALALAQPWGRRLPARPLVSVAWVGGGFLVPMLPYMVISGVPTQSGSTGMAATPWVVEDAGSDLP